MFGAEPGGDGEDVDEFGSGGEGDLAGFLDDRAVGHGVGERHAEFDHVGAGFDETVDQGLAFGGSRTADGGVDDQRGTLFGAAAVETTVDSRIHDNHFS